MKTQALPRRLCRLGRFKCLLKGWAEPLLSFLQGTGQALGHHSHFLGLGEGKMEYRSQQTDQRCGI